VLNTVKPAPQQTKTARLMRFLRSDDAKGYLYIAPWFLGFILLGVGPLLNTFYNSLTKYDLFKPAQWVGLQNYEQILFQDEVFGAVIRNMLIYVVASTAISIGLGLVLACLLAQGLPGSQIFRVVLYVPSLLVGVATGILFKQVFAGGEAGLANQFVLLFGGRPFKWLTDFNAPWLALVALILVNLWFVGGTMLIFLAGLKGISPTYYEAARLDGAGALRCFWNVSVPLLSPVIVFNTIMVLIAHIQVFETPLSFAASSGSVTNGVDPLGYENNLGTFLTYIYTKAFVYGEFGYASAVAFIVFLLTLGLTMLVLWAAGRFSYYGEQVKN
jgi:ABC-type sugar transport system permease subunit